MEPFVTAGSKSFPWLFLANTFNQKITTFAQKHGSEQVFSLIFLILLVYFEEELANKKRKKNLNKGTPELQ